MTEKKTKYDDDDGRVICNMDVEGMHWRDRRARRREDAARPIPQGEQMTSSEFRRFTWNAVLAALTIALVFSVTWVLFILFCTQVWLR